MLLVLIVGCLRPAAARSHASTDCDGWESAGRLEGDGDVGAAVPLPDGRVFVVGDRPRSPQTFDPATGAVRSAGVGPWKFLVSPSVALVGPTRVLVVGGEYVGEWVAGHRRKTTPLCYVGDLERGAWTAIVCPEQWAPEEALLPRVTPLPSGGAVAFDGVDSAAVFDGNGWTRETATPAPVDGHAQILLDDGRLFVVGGRKQSTAALFDAGSGTWAAAVAPPVEMWRPALSLLPDGRVLATAFAAAGHATRMTLLYDAKTDAWAAAPDLLAERSGVAIATLADGSVLVIGGWDANLHRVPFAEVLRPGAAAWAYAGTSCVSRDHATATATATGALVFGGLAADGTKTDGGFSFMMESTSSIEKWDVSAPLRGSANRAEP